MLTLALASTVVATLASVITASHRPVTPGELCYRKCVPLDTRICYFHFDVHPYQTLSRACYDCPRNTTDCERPECVPGDGVKRRIIAVNRQMPGPAIQVCLGDQIRVDVKNSLHDEGITVHWHGLTMRSSDPRDPDTPYMDGVPNLTQCPINPGATFRYTFYASDAGTYWYHSHQGFERGDGLFGAIIIRQPPAEDPNIGTYDFDLPQHVILVTDWLHIPSQDKFVLRQYGGGDESPDSMLVNGQGPYQEANSSSLAAQVPYARFIVRPGNRYRLRLISTGILSCPITFSVEQHAFTIISTDGSPVVPRPAHSLVIYSGERWDVVIQADQGRSGTFWMSFMGSIDCANTRARQFALLEYESQRAQVKGTFYSSQQQGGGGTPAGALPPPPAFTDVPPPGVQVNSVNSACYDDLVCVADLRSHYSLPEALKTPHADITLYLAFQVRNINNDHFYSRVFYPFEAVDTSQQVTTPQINNLSYAQPAAPLLLTGLRGQERRVCNAEHPPPDTNCDADYCECLHLYSIPLGATVDLVLIDEGINGDDNHPVHLHGDHFWVLGQDRPNDVPEAEITRSKVMEMDRAGRLVRNLDRPVYKDTVTLPDGGYTVVRFLASNPGYWLLHCHVLLHSAAGMDLVIRVGADKDLPDVPPNFPTCGNFIGGKNNY
ncbi:uncharacterized protein [Procambarus clarkii]|uniref:uncharacterized protein n=1 Tax=Procambarus clarkii TaxID=6728 RepID=UPI00374479A8